jgi:hypothetical protein
MDLIALIVAAVQAAVALALLFVVPGITLGPVLLPGASNPLMRIGRAIGVSLLTTTLACTALAWAGVLRPTVLIAVLIGLTILPLHRRVPQLPRPPRERARRWWAGAAVASLLVVVLVIVPSRADVGPDLLPYTSTVWYYANLARVVAAGGGLPSVLPEWGTERPFQTDYLPVTAHTAAAFQLLPGDVLLQLELYRLAILLAGVVLGALLFRRWVSSWIAIVGSIALFDTARLAFKFDAYKPETFAFVLALFAIYLVDRAVTERTPRITALAIATSALVFLCHAEVFLVLCAAIAAIAIARWVVVSGAWSERGGGAPRYGRRLGLSVDTSRWALTRLAIGGIVLIGALALGSVANLGLTGQLRILGYAAGGGQAGSAAVGDTGTFAPVDQVPPGWTFGVDPTWNFYVASVAPKLDGQPPPHSFFDSRLLPRAIVNVWPGLDGRIREQLVVLVGLLALPVLAWPFLDRRRRLLVLTWLGFGAILLVGSFALFSLAHTYVPQRVGPRRLMPYELFVPVMAVVTGLFVVDRLLRPGWRALLPRRGTMVAAGMALALLAAGVVSAAPTTQAADDADPGLTRVGYTAYGWMARSLPADARVLANAYTDGALTALTNRVGIVDGRAVYLEAPDQLAESTRLLLAARTLFLDPAGAPARSFLDDERIDYLLVVAPPGTGNDVGGYEPFDTNVSALRSSPRYTLVQSFGDGRLLLFRVEPAA